MKSEPVDRGLVFGLVGLLAGFVLVLVLRLAYPDLFDTSSYGTLVGIGIILGCGVLGALAERDHSPLL